MDSKWIAVLSIGVAAAMFAPLTVMEYSKSQCRIEAIKAGVAPEKINTACGVK